jgi:chromosome segregation ATPase
VVERIVEVPVEKIVEKIVDREVRVEVPGEKIVEKTVVDETRVKELEGLLAEERRHTADLQQRVDESLSNASSAAQNAAAVQAGLSREIGERDAKIGELESLVASRDAALKDAVDRENKQSEQIRNLEDELRRLPQAASEVADIQAALFTIMSRESEEIAKLIEIEKREFEDFRKRHQERLDRLVERRRDILRRSGSNIEEMTRKALVERPEDPRTAQLRSDEPLAAAYRAAHEAYLARREQIGHVPEIAGISAGGMPDRVKCLHALVAHSLAAGPGINPLGDEALAELPPWWVDGPCVSTGYA